MSGLCLLRRHLAPIPPWNGTISLDSWQNILSPRLSLIKRLFTSGCAQFANKAKAKVTHYWVRIRDSSKCSAAVFSFTGVQGWIYTRLDLYRAGLNIKTGSGSLQLHLILFLWLLLYLVNTMHLTISIQYQANANINKHRRKITIKYWDWKLNVWLFFLFLWQNTSELRLAQSSHRKC